MSVDFGGPILERHSGGKVGMNLEIRSDQPLKTIRIEANSKFPLKLLGAKINKKFQWQAHKAKGGALILSPNHQGRTLKSLAFQLQLKPKRGRGIESIFGSGARDRRPSFWMTGIGQGGQKHKEEVFLPYIPNE